YSAGRGAQLQATQITQTLARWVTPNAPAPAPAPAAGALRTRPGSRTSGSGRRPACRSGRAWDRTMRGLPKLHRAAAVVFAVQDVDGGARGVDPAGLGGQVVVGEVVVEVAAEGRRPARRVDRAGLLAERRRRRRAHQPVHQPRLVFVADLRMPERVELAQLA